MHARLASADLVLQIEDDRIAYDEQSQFKIFFRDQAAFVQLREQGQQSLSIQNIAEEEEKARRRKLPM